MTRLKIITLMLLLWGSPLTAEQQESFTPQQIGQSATKELLTSLKQNLVTAINDTGVSGAVSFCSEEAIPLTAAASRRAGANISIKRTSTRLRNPLNAPDELELQALSFFEANPKTPYFLQEEDVNTTRYYKPLRINAMCLQCHGGVEDIPTEVRQTIKEKYPADQATGYKDGDLRGIVRVSIKR